MPCFVNTALQPFYCARMALIAITIRMSKIQENHKSDSETYKTTCDQQPFFFIRSREQENWENEKGAGGKHKKSRERGQKLEGSREPGPPPPW